jgi:hypothetical protein
VAAQHLEAANKAALNSQRGRRLRGAPEHQPERAPHRDPDFWAGSKTITDGGTQIEYVIHRLCAARRRYDENNNFCVQTSVERGRSATSRWARAARSTRPTYAGAPMLHYVITARISGPRGASVTNQMIVLIGA